MYFKLIFFIYSIDYLKIIYVLAFKVLKNFRPILYKINPEHVLEMVFTSQGS